MKKRIVGLVCALFTTAFSLAQSPSIRLGLLKGLASSPAAYLMENQEKLTIQNMDFELFDSESGELTSLLQGKIDLAFLSTEAAAKVFNLREDSILILASVQYTNPYLVTNDENINSLSDLKGKKILAAGKNSLSELLFNDLLAKNSLVPGPSPQEVNLDFSLPPAIIPGQIISQKENYALLEEPFISIILEKSAKANRSLSIQKNYVQISGDLSANFPKILLVARADFARENVSLLKRFITLYKNAESWTLKNPVKAASLIEKQGFGLQASIAKKALPYAGLTFKDSAACREEIERTLQLFMEADSQTIGGKIPGPEFYFKN